MGAEGSNRASESGSKVSSSVVFLLGGPGSGVVSVEGGLLRNSSSSDSSGYINGGITLYSSSEYLSSVSMTTAPRRSWVHYSLCCVVATSGQA